MDTTALLEDEWEYMLNMLPSDLEQTAAEKLALVRRREIGSAGDLLRLALCYGLCYWRLQQTAAEALRSAIRGVIPISQVRGGWAGLRRHLCDSPRKRRRGTLASLKTLNCFLTA
jgi:hypothetical protein